MGDPADLYPWYGVRIILTMVRLLAGYSNHFQQIEKLTNRLRDLGFRGPEPARRPARRASQLSQSTIDELVVLYRSDMSGPALAKHFAINESTVYAHLHRLKIERRPYRKLSGSQLQRALDLRRAGAPVRVIAAEVGVSKSAVHSAILDSDQCATLKR